MVRERRFSEYLVRLQSAGRVVFSREDVQRELGLSRGAVLDAAERQQRKKNLISPRRGFYVIVPPQYLSWGAPPPSWYIDDLMRREGRPYYVGILKAAELHGATHQAVMEFQVVTDKRLPEIRAGRSLVTFHYRKDMAGVSQGIEERKTETGRMKISTVELTLLDLLRYSRAAGGLDNIATIVADVGVHADPEKLASLSSGLDRTVTQRLGYLLERYGHQDRAAALHQRLPEGSRLPWVELEPSQASDPDFKSEPQERNERWHVIIRRPPERDE